VNSSLPVKSVKDLIALAKARPGELNYAAGGVGGPPHLAGELFKSLASVDILRVPYKGGGPALNGLLGGEAQLMFATASAAMQHVKSGKLRALGITSAQPSELVPGVLPIVVRRQVSESNSSVGFFYTLWNPNYPLESERKPALWPASRGLFTGPWKAKKCRDI